VIGAVLVTAAVVSLRDLVQRGKPASVTWRPNRVAVSVLANRTDVAELDELGTMVADWVTLGLARTPGLAVGGSYYLTADTLSFSLRVIDVASGGVLRARAHPRNATGPHARFGGDPPTDPLGPPQHRRSPG